jgi:bifunctional DNA-binding transcriptional regulator/antitoxin component of YhaV-PrlF toxin-antitoxin module
MKEKFVCKIKKANKYSYSITIPKEIMEKYEWREKQKMRIVDKGRGKVEITDWRN